MTIAVDWDVKLKTKLFKLACADINRPTSQQLEYLVLAFIHSILCLSNQGMALK